MALTGERMSIDLTPAQIEDFRRRGFTTLRGVFSPEEIGSNRPAIRDYVMRSRQALDSSEQAIGASPRKAVCNLEEAPPEVADFIKSPRLGEIAARLLSVDSVRILHFTGFFKSGGGPATPWHQDLTFIPLDTEKALSIWVPLTDVTPDMGALIFAEGSHLRGQLNPVADTGQFPIRQNGVMRAGDVSVHMGWTLHTSLKNSSTTMREAVAISYYADGARIRINSNVPMIQSFLDTYFAGLAPGDLAVGPMTPVVFPRGDGEMSSSRD
jgi:ectoine hydroxylase-related dioxygenase (phytanoyl-CoA dioxygenase family)